VNKPYKYTIIFLILINDWRTDWIHVGLYNTILSTQDYEESFVIIPTATKENGLVFAKL